MPISPLTLNLTTTLLSRVGAWERNQPGLWLKVEKGSLSLPDGPWPASRGPCSGSLRWPVGWCLHTRQCPFHPHSSMPVAVGCGSPRRSVADQHQLQPREAAL